ncbi:lysophospholipid acyltransferase family protein [Chloroflexota bacterium]
MPAPAKAMNWFYWFIRFCIGVLLRLFTQFRVQGREHVPADGAVIVVSNHLSVTDPPVLSFALPRRARFMAKQELFRNPAARWFITNLGAFPLDRSRIDRQAIREAEKSLKQGLALIIFAEGGRSRDGRLGEAYSGAAMLALRLGVPILPVAISGTEKIGQRLRRLRRPKITIKIGRPIPAPQPNGHRRTATTELTGAVMSHITRLLPAAYRGHYREELTGEVRD